MNAEAPQVVHAPERDRYELRLGEHLAGVADYRRDGDVVDVWHTEVDPALRGRGLAAVLVDQAVDDLEAQGLTVRASCSYVRRRLHER